MRRLAIVAAISSAACPAFAQEGGFYVGGGLGAVISSETDQTYTPGATIGSTGTVSTDHELGFSGSAFAGYDFGAFRLEVEAGVLSADVEKLSSSFALPSASLVSGSQNGHGEVRAQSVMANATVDVGDFYGFNLFLGGGAGVAKLKIADLQTATAAGPLLDDEDDWRFAWQGLIGVRKPLTDNIDVHVRYRYLSVDDVEMVGQSGRAVSAELSSHALEGGISFNF